MENRAQLEEKELSVMVNFGYECRANPRQIARSPQTPDPGNDKISTVTEQPSNPQGSEVISEAQLPEKLRTLWSKGLAALDVGNFDYTISLLQAVLKEEPRFLDGRKRLREAAVRKKEGESKRFGISKGGGISAMKLQPMVKSNPQAAIVQLREIFATEPHNPQANQLLFEAATRAEMPMTAGFALETLVKGNPENTKDMHQLADYYMEHAFYEQAGQVYGQILQRDPTDLQANLEGKECRRPVSSMAKQNYGGSDFRKSLRCGPSLSP